MRQARALLALPPRPGSAEADANAALQAAAASCDAAANPLFASVRLSYAADSAAADAPVRPARTLLQAFAVACNAAGSGMHKPAATLCRCPACSSEHSYASIDQHLALLRRMVSLHYDGQPQVSSCFLPLQSHAALRGMM